MKKIKNKVELHYIFNTEARYLPTKARHFETDFFSYIFIQIQIQILYDPIKGPQGAICKSTATQ